MGRKKRANGSLRVAGLFAGIGGLELGLESAGFTTELLCEIDENAQRVLGARFPDIPLVSDVRRLEALPDVDVVTAGFPCQDLSQMGSKAGIAGEKSGVVTHLLRLLRKAKPRPNWVVIENVSYMLRLDAGDAMRFLTSKLESLGYRWAYRVVDARSFGVPQRRLRVILVAARDGDPRDVLFADNVSDAKVVTRRLQSPLPIDAVGPKEVQLKRGKAYGFYWTEGRIGIGWATDAVPPIKGGSGLGIPSPPAIWIPYTNSFGVPSIEDGERLQGFPPGWTDVDGLRRGRRWKLVGNAVCVPVVEWVGRRIASPGKYTPTDEAELSGKNWPLAAHGRKGHRPAAVPLTVWPLKGKGPVLSRFLEDPLVPLSYRAIAGFHKRAKATVKIRYAPEFLASAAAYLRTVQPEQTS